MAFPPIRIVSLAPSADPERDSEFCAPEGIAVQAAAVLGRRLVLLKGRGHKR